MAFTYIREDTYFGFYHSMFYWIYQERLFYDRESSIAGRTRFGAKLGGRWTTQKNSGQMESLTIMQGIRKYSVLIC